MLYSHVKIWKKQDQIEEKIGMLFVQRENGSKHWNKFSSPQSLLTNKIDEDLIKKLGVKSV